MDGNQGVAWCGAAAGTPLWERSAPAAPQPQQPHIRTWQGS